jgi:hypothetical protein
MRTTSFLVLFLLTIGLCSCDGFKELVDKQIANDTVQLEGCIANIDFRFAPGSGLFGSEEVRETILRFKDGRVLAFRGIYNQFIENHCYRLDYSQTRRELISILRMDSGG